MAGIVLAGGRRHAVRLEKQAWRASIRATRQADISGGSRAMPGCRPAAQAISVTIIRTSLQMSHDGFTKLVRGLLEGVVSINYSHQESSMLKRTTLAKSLLLAFSGTVAVSTGGVVFAQTAPAQELQRVEVTGSRIKRVDTETASPVQVITRDQIDRSGAKSVSELLTSVPASNTGSFNENAVASFTPGAAGVSLRGLGAQATLILINGRRVAPFGFAQGGQTTFVDVNSIPLEVVERVEILLDGASAIYGSDAIGGVVNVILRKDFSGFQISGSLGTSSERDANSRNISLTIGKGSMASDGYNIFANVTHEGQDPVKANQRDLTRTADFRRFGLLDLRSSYSYPGNLYAASGVAGGAFLGAMPGCTPLSEAGAATNGRCVYQGTDHQDIIAKTSRDTLFVAGSLTLGGGFELFGDAVAGRTKYEAESPSYSSSTYFSTGTLPQAYIPLPVGHPQNPSATDPVALRYRFADVAHVTAVQSDTQRAAFGIRNRDLSGWDVESGILYSHSKTKVTTTGLLNDSVLTDEVLDPSTGMARNSFIFGNPGLNDPGLMSRLYPTLRDLGTTSTASFDVRGSRELFQLPAGPLQIAIGAEVRHEKYTSTPDALTASGALSVLGASASGGSRSISALYAELSIPILKDLEGSIAGRYDKYSDFGSTTNPKVGLKYKILPNLAVRATYAEGFRAPAITETTQTPSRGFYSGIRDPQLCATPDPANPNCDLSLEALFSSNPALKPERSKSTTVGLVFEPLDNLSIAFDVYKIKRRNEIASIDPDYLLAHEGEYPGYVIRKADGTIDSLNLQYTNLGSTQVMGYDVDVKSSFNVGELGKLAINASYDALPHYDVANVKDAPEVNYAGTYQQPKERWKLGLALDRGPWRGNVTFNYSGGFLRAFTPSDLTCPYDASGTNQPELCSVKHWLTADVFVGYKGFKNWDFGLSIKNLFNQSAPLDERLVTRYTAFNSQFYNQSGRYFTLGAKYTFW
ncbi:MAG: TonB-dependent receptor [Burkholderiales bacterium]